MTCTSATFELCRKTAKHERFEPCGTLGSPKLAASLFVCGSRTSVMAFLFAQGLSTARGGGEETSCDAGWGREEGGEAA